MTLNGDRGRGRDQGRNRNFAEGDGAARRPIPSPPRRSPVGTLPDRRRAAAPVPAGEPGIRHRAAGLDLYSSCRGWSIRSKTFKAHTGVQRVAQFLADLTSWKPAPAVRLPYNKRLIAGNLGMQPKACRAFARLREHGVRSMPTRRDRRYRRYLQLALTGAGSATGGAGPQGGPLSARPTGDRSRQAVNRWSGCGIRKTA